MVTYSFWNSVGRPAVLVGVVGRIGALMMGATRI
jgi:hypothetical protein